MAHKQQDNFNAYGRPLNIESKYKGQLYFDLENNKIYISNLKNSKINWIEISNKSEESVSIYKYNNGLTKTTSDEFIDKLDLIVELEEDISKEVLINWSYGVYNSVGNAIAIRLLKNNEEIVNDYCYIAGGGVNTFRLRGAFLKENIKNGDNFKIQFKRDIGGQAKIKQVKLILRGIN